MEEGLKEVVDKSSQSIDEYTAKIDDAYRPRWDKNFSKVIFNYQQMKFLQNGLAKINIIVFGCDYCPDCASTIPILQKMSQISEYINLRIVDRDADKKLFAKYYTNSRGLIPVVLFLNEDFDEVSRWVERGLYAYKLIYDAKTLAEGSKAKFNSLKRDKFKGNSAQLFQSLLDELFSALERAVYMVNIAILEVS